MHILKLFTKWLKLGKFVYSPKPSTPSINMQLVNWREVLYFFSLTKETLFCISTKKKQKTFWPFFSTLSNINIKLKLHFKKKSIAGTQFLPSWSVGHLCKRICKFFVAYAAHNRALVYVFIVILTETCHPLGQGMQCLFFMHHAHQLLLPTQKVFSTLLVQWCDQYDFCLFLLFTVWIITIILHMACHEV